jgi:hypothetical protein
MHYFPTMLCRLPGFRNSKHVSKVLTNNLRQSRSQALTREVSQGDVSPLHENYEAFESHFYVRQTRSYEFGRDSLALQRSFRQYHHSDMTLQRQRRIFTSHHPQIN